MAKKTSKSAMQSRKAAAKSDDRFFGVKMTTRDDMRRDTYVVQHDKRAASA